MKNDNMDAMRAAMCRCAIPSLGEMLQSALDESHAAAIRTEFTPKRILKSGSVTIVFWNDGTKTMVKCSETETANDYDAFTAALAIKIFGSNSKLKRVITAKTEIQPPKKGKKDAVIPTSDGSTESD